MVGRLLLLISVFSISCGPSTTARQAEKDQENAVLRQQKSSMAAVEGKWLGCLNDIDLKPKADFELQGNIAVERGKKPPTDPIEVPKDPIPPLPPDNGPMDACAKTKGTPVILLVMVVDMLQPNTNKNEITEVPTMVGLFKTVAADSVAVVFSSGLYNEADGHVQLQSTPPIPTPTGPVPGTTTGAVSGSNIMRLQLNGNNLSGQYIAPQKFANVTFHRIQ